MPDGHLADNMALNPALISLPSDFLSFFFTVLESRLGLDGHSFLELRDRFALLVQHSGFDRMQRHSGLPKFTWLATAS